MDPILLIFLSIIVFSLTVIAIVAIVFGMTKVVLGVIQALKSLAGK